MAGMSFHSHTQISLGMRLDKHEHSQYVPITQTYIGLGLASFPGVEGTPGNEANIDSFLSIILVFSLFFNSCQFILQRGVVNSEKIQLSLHYFMCLHLVLCMCGFIVKMNTVGST